MKTNAPKSVIWIIAVVLGALGLAGKFVYIADISPNAFWLVAVGFVLLALGSILKGL